MIKESLKTITLSLIAIYLVGVAYAWTDPTLGPPSGNTYPPITTASNSQTKAGWLTLDNLETYGNTDLATVTGNVGIGTTSPQAKLHAVQSGGNVNPSLTYNSSAAYILNTAGADLAMGVLTAGPWSYWMQARSWGNASLPLAFNPSGGNVGIGTTNPDAKLTVTGSSDITTGMSSVGEISMKDSAPQINFDDADNKDWAIHVNSDNMYFVMQPWLYKTLVLRGTGDVGIGTDTPSNLSPSDSDLEVTGGVSVGGNLNVNGKLVEGDVMRLEAAPFIQSASGALSYRDNWPGNVEVNNQNLSSWYLDSLKTISIVVSGSVSAQNNQYSGRCKLTAELNGVTQQYNPTSANYSKTFSFGNVSGQMSTFRLLWDANQCSGSFNIAGVNVYKWSGYVF